MKKLKYQSIIFLRRQGLFLFCPSANKLIVRIVEDAFQEIFSTTPPPILTHLSHKWNLIPVNYLVRFWPGPVARSLTRPRKCWGCLKKFEKHASNRTSFKVRANTDKLIPRRATSISFTLKKCSFLVSSYTPWSSSQLNLKNSNIHWSTINMLLELVDMLNRSNRLIMREAK